jgi:hypothetical protein
VLYEALFHYPEKKRRRIFERQGGGLKFQRGLGTISGTRELLTPRSLALSIARRFDEPLVSEFAEELVGVQAIGVKEGPPRGPRFVGPSLTMFSERLAERSDDVRGLRSKGLALLRMADLGIHDVVVDDHDLDIHLLHSTAGGTAQLHYLQESAGTRAWFDAIAPILVALRDGSTLLFDELDASLHPTLSMQLIKLFTDPATNPRGAQLIFAAHDTSLLNHLNRDEVWLTEKVNGVTKLGALAEFAGERVRKSQNLEKAYLGGRFGALPDVDRTEFLRALGLIG